MASMLLRWFEHGQVYHPSRDMDATGAELGRPFENVFFKTSDGVQLNAWFYPAVIPARTPLAVLVCHGNAGNITNRLELYRTLLDAGAAVFAFDYRGYGLSKGRPGEEGTYLDAQAAHQWLGQRGFDGKKIVVYGESLGGGVASELCVREPSAAIILQSTFTSILDIGAELFPWLPVRWINSIRYDTCSKLPRLKVPVLICHSRDDRLIGFHHCQKNLEAANEPKQFCQLQGDHNEIVWKQPGFKVAIEKFIASIATST